MKHITTTIARSSSCRIDQCTCGAVHITVGGTTIRLRDEAARELRDVLVSALRTIDERSSAAPAPPSFRLIRSFGDDDGEPDLH